MAHHRGKRFRAAYEKVDRDHSYTPAEAIALVKETASTKFDETVEVHLRLGVNVRHAEEQLRGTLALPNGLGKEVTVAVFAQGDAAKAATGAGADHVGAQDLADRVSEGWTDFDLAIATPDLMGPVVSKLGRILGPQGKMPNPKVGTVTNDVAKAVSEAKAGKVEYRTDRQAIVHLTIGRASFDERALLENYAPGRRRPRDAICSPSPWRRRWGPASGWIRPVLVRPRSWRASHPATARAVPIRKRETTSRRRPSRRPQTPPPAPREPEPSRWPVIAAWGDRLPSRLKRNLPKTVGGAARWRPGGPAQARSGACLSPPVRGLSRSAGEGDGRSR
jgi:large subunit ribosomal protein L1